MPLAAPVTRTVNPTTDRLSCLKSDIEGSLNGVMRLGSTRLASIPREVKLAEKASRASTLISFQRKPGAGVAGTESGLAG
jgi:hypothetical protein